MEILLSKIIQEKDSNRNSFNQNSYNNSDSVILKIIQSVYTIVLKEYTDKYWYSIK